METCIGKPLLMHLITLDCVFFFRSSSKHENRTHFGVMEEHGMKLYLWKAIKTTSNSLKVPGLLVNQGPTGHVTITARPNMNITS